MPTVTARFVAPGFTQPSGGAQSTRLVRADDALTALADLERALAAAPADEALLAVYADALIDHGDPRGEILALEQRLPELHASAAAATRQRLAHLTRDVLGGDLGLEARLTHGFLQLTLLEQLRPRDALVTIAATALRGSAGVALRRLHLVASPETIDRLLAIVAERPRPALTALVLVSEPAPEILAARRLLDLSYLAPALTALTLRGAPPFAPRPHPTLAQSEVQGGAALDWLLAAPRYPALRTLVLVALGRPLADALAPLRPAAFPALDTFDLSDVAQLPTAIADLAAHPIASQLTQLVMRAPDRPEAIADLNRALMMLPALQEVRVPHNYLDLARALTHPRARFVLGAPPPWRDPALVDAPALLAVDVPGTPFTGHVELAGLAWLLEATALPPAAVSAWRAFWTLVDGAPSAARGHGPRAPFPAAVLAHAIDALDPLAVAQLRGWSALRVAIGPSASRRLAVMIAHYRP